MWTAAVCLAVLLLVAAAGYLYLLRNGVLSRVDNLDRVAIVFSSHGGDGAQIAQVIALVTEDGHAIEFVDPATRVTVPGTSFSHLRDAYPFGGAAAVAQLLAPRAGGRVAWVDVPEGRWVALLQAGPSVQVTLTARMDVFDGNRLASFPAGGSTVSARDVPLLLIGAERLPAAQRDGVRSSVASASLEALSQLRPAEAASDLSPRALARLLKVVAERR